MCHSFGLFPQQDHKIRRLGHLSDFAQFLTMPKFLAYGTRLKETINSGPKAS